MDVILLEKIRNLGDIGAEVSVKSGYARNYLIPYGKAVLATKENLEKFAKMRAELEKKAAESLKIASLRAAKFQDAVVTIAVKATEDGKLFGSVGTTNILEALKNQGLEVERSEISLPTGAIRHVGEYVVDLLMHSDVTCKVKVNVVAISE